MNGGALPYVLMFAAVGMALASADREPAWRSVGGLALAALLFSFVPLPEKLQKGIFIGFWLSMIGTAALAVAAREISQPLAIAAATIDGAWAGALASASESRTALAFALPVSLLFVAGQWFIRRGYGIAPRVFSSWLIAVAALAMFVSLVPTPGYEADHME